MIFRDPKVRNRGLPPLPQQLTTTSNQFIHSERYTETIPATPQIVKQNLEKESRQRFTTCDHKAK